MLRLSFFTIGIMLFLAACTSDVEFKVKDIDGIPSADLTDTYPYVKNSAYSENISNCIQAIFVVDLCTLETLPFIGMESNTPTINDIMDRVVVSHDWMGERFEAVLNELPIDMLPLFKAVTAVVIDDDIRPAYYTRGTGAIYLDPDYLWLTVDDKRTINLQPDYRSGFGSELSFRFVSRYLVDGEYAYDYGSLFDNSTRELDDILLLISRLLLHELAHANDSMPPALYTNLNSSGTAYSEITRLSEFGISTQLIESQPLTSSTMFRLADIMYYGEKALSEDISLTASDVSAEFAPDGASHTYSYSSQYEDVAMLFEMSMMRYFYGTDTEIALTSTGDFCNELDIGWGLINRIGDNHVKSRAEFISSLILNGTSLEVFFQNYPSSEATNGNWCLESQSLSLASSKSTSTNQAKRVPKEDFFRPFL